MGGQGVEKGASLCLCTTCTHHDIESEGFTVNFLTEREYTVRDMDFPQPCDLFFARKASFRAGSFDLPPA